MVLGAVTCLITGNTKELITIRADTPTKPDPIRADKPANIDLDASTVLLTR